MPAASEVSRLIVEHFRANQRDLPWRRTTDPYSIWVSEIMLQQTRVATVIPYYQRWLDRFPTVAALADAALDDVLSAWAGLGYYSRARNLHRGAAEVVGRYEGRVPSTTKQLQSLPGIGRYTAGAIASMAFGTRAPLVDGNVARVLARVYEIDEDIKKSATVKRLWELAGDLVPEAAPGDFNQGLMELGATVCTPSSPRCEHCPLEALCRARASGRQHELPIMPARKRAADLALLDECAAWIERRGRLLLARRTPQGLYGGLWELPRASNLDELGALFRGRVELDEPASPVTVREQVLSHRRLRVRVYTARLRGRLGKPANERYDNAEWRAIDSIDGRGVSSATRTIIDRYLEQPGWKPTKKPSAFSPKATRKSSKASTPSATRRTRIRTSTRPRSERPKASPS